MNKTYNYKCTVCGQRKDHTDDCIFITGVVDVDYVECNLCSYRRKTIKRHIKLAHNLTPESYDGKITCDNTSANCSKANTGKKIKENWITKLKTQNLDLAAEKLAKMGKAVSNTIMNNPELRNKRSNVMKKLWTIHRKHFTEVASKTAIETSKRKEVLEKRTEQLRNWRNKNPDLFYTKCTHKLITTFISKPQKTLANWVITKFPNLKFAHNQRLYSDTFTTKTKQRQIDICSKENSIIIEFDGPVHYVDFWGQLDSVKIKDEQINQMTLKNYLVIRISYDQWNEKRSEFVEDCKIQVENILNSIEQHRGKTIKIGTAYNQ